jgi:hypothetical protein
LKKVGRTKEKKRQENEEWEQYTNIEEIIPNRKKAFFSRNTKKKVSSS